MNIGKRIERLRGRTKLAEVARKARPGEREHELAELRHQREVQKTRDSFRAEDRTERRARRWAGVSRVMTAIGDAILAFVAWLTARWLVVRGWVADRVVIVPVLVAGGSALYGQYNYLTDSPTPQFPGDSTGMGWHPLVSLFAGLAIETMAFVLFRAAKRGRDKGDDVRLETTAGWGIVSGAVAFNSWHVDPLAGFLSAIGPIAWEIRERRERRNREIDNGTRGKAPIPMPRLSARFRYHYPAEYTEMLRIALWERARLSYPRLVAQIEHKTAADELAANIAELANLVSTNPVLPAARPGAPRVSSHDALAVEPGSAEPGSATTTVTPPEPGSPAEPGSNRNGTVVTSEPGSGEPGSATGFGNVDPNQVRVQVVTTSTPDSSLITAYPVWQGPQVNARFGAAEPGFEPGSATVTSEPGSTEPGSHSHHAGATEPGSVPVGARPGSAVTASTTEPGSTEGQQAEPGSVAAREPGSGEPGSAIGNGVTSNPVPGGETAQEQTRPMPRLVTTEPGSAEPEPANQVRHLHVLHDEDAQTVREMVDLCVQLLDREGRWVNRDVQMAYLRNEHGKSMSNRVRDAWWAQMRPYREVVKATRTG